MNRCELIFLDRVEIDLRRAEAQHADYLRCLADLGFEVITLPADPELPDSVFVEDPVVAVDEVAVMTRMGALSRRGESLKLADAIEPYRQICWMTAPATLDGGDVVRIGRELYAGLSRRTNRHGIGQLEDFVAPFGYKVHPVEIRDCLHLKSGACYVGRGTLLINRDWINPEPFRAYRLIDVPEPWAADVLAAGNTILMPAGFPRTEQLLAAEGFHVCTVDVSELQKAEAGVTCMSVILD